MKSFLEKVGQDVLSFASFFDVIVDSFILMKVDGDSFRYIFLNESAKKIVNAKEDIYGKTLEEAAPKEMIQILVKNYYEARNTKKPVKFYETMHTTNGEFHGETTLNPVITEDGECSDVMAIVRDITERVEKEQKLKKTQRIFANQQKRLQSLIENNADAVIELIAKETSSMSIRR